MIFCPEKSYMVSLIEKEGYFRRVLIFAYIYALYLHICKKAITMQHFLVSLSIIYAVAKIKKKSPQILYAGQVSRQSRNIYMYACKREFNTIQYLLVWCRFKALSVHHHRTTSDGRAIVSPPHPKQPNPQSLSLECVHTLYIVYIYSEREKHARRIEQYRNMLH